MKHESDPKFLLPDLIPHRDTSNKLALCPRRLAICKHCRGVFAGEIDEFGEAGPDGVCPAGDPS